MKRPDMLTNTTIMVSSLSVSWDNSNLLMWCCELQYGNSIAAYLVNESYTAGRVVNKPVYQQLSQFLLHQASIFFAPKLSSFTERARNTMNQEAINYITTVRSLMWLEAEANFQQMGWWHFRGLISQTTKVLYFMKLSQRYGGIVFIICGEKCTDSLI